MKSYRLVVRQQGRMVGILKRAGQRRWKISAWRGRLFGIAGGYDCELLVADSERRLLESGPEGMKILMREACYRPVTSPCKPWGRKS
ncbi:putative cytoplasmic protein [Salmonella enterica subsp. arizonae]|uniref:Putative cytoplasmic protein n=1 Tax=Salmonella enterica subsp. arizonae TaxID=59203 RepID=A0A379S0W5_SALER|nr:putative cytoplasmic protein [Salmonella enterica subsp. arizonae]